MIVFDISQSDEIASWIREGVRRVARRASIATAVRLVGVIQNEIVPAQDPPPIDQRAYVEGWQFEPTAEGADVYNAVPHAPMVDGGVKNVVIGRKLINALAEWAVRKGLVSKTKEVARARGGFKTVRRTKTEIASDARSIAWAIATKAKKGQGLINKGQGFHIVEKAAARIGAFFREEFAREMDRGLR